MNRLLAASMAGLLMAAQPAFAQGADGEGPSPRERAATAGRIDAARSAMRALSSRNLPVSQEARASPRIVNGEPEVPDGQWAWTVSVIADGAICGGAYVAPHVVPLSGGGKYVQDWVQRSTKLNWVVTAAHCVTDRGGAPIAASKIKVFGGTLRSDDRRRIEQEVEQLRVHGGYEPRTMANDIALLRVGPPVGGNSGSDVKTTSIRLPADLDARWLYSTYAALTVHGWGRTSEGGFLSPFLQKVVVPLVKRSDCARAYEALGSTISSSMLCAGFSSGGYDSCQGDSGGPIEFIPTAGGVVNPSNDPVLAGVVSWGHGCARQTLYGVYTNVLHMRPWLEQAVLEMEP